MTVGTGRRIKTIVVRGSKSKNFWLLIDKKYENCKIRDLKYLIRSKLLKKKDFNSKITLSLDSFAFSSKEEVSIILNDDVIKVTVFPRKNSEKKTRKKGIQNKFASDLKSLVEEIPFYDDFNCAYKPKKRKSYLNSTKSDVLLVIDKNDNFDDISAEKNYDQKNHIQDLSENDILDINNSISNKENVNQKTNNLLQKKNSDIFPNDRSNLSTGIGNTLSYIQSKSSCSDLGTYIFNPPAPKHIVFSSSEDGEIKESHFHKYEPCLSIPKSGTRLAFKVTELSEDYCPQISDYKVGTVKSSSEGEEKILIELDDLYVRPTYLGKFGLPGEEEKHQSELSYKDKIMLLKWDDIIEPKIIN